MSSFDLGRFAAPLFVPVLSSPPLVLRPFDPGDRDLVRRASLDPLVTAISSVPVACDDAAAEDFIERQHTLAAEGHGYPFAISLLNDDAVSTGIGCIGLWLRDIEHGRASVGYWLLEPARGRGLAGEGAAGCRPVRLQRARHPAPAPLRRTLERGVGPDRPPQRDSTTKPGCAGGSAWREPSAMPTVTPSWRRSGRMIRRRASP